MIFETYLELSGIYIFFAEVMFTISDRVERLDQLEYGRLGAIQLCPHHRSADVERNRQVDRLTGVRGIELYRKLAFAILAQSIGYLSAKLMGLDRDTCFTIGVEVGLQNVVLAILIANLLLKRPEFSLFVVVYAASILLVMLPWVYIHRRLGSRAIKGGENRSRFC